MIKRIAENKLIELAAQFRAVAVTGPRQSGKTTLVRTAFPNKPYVSFENPDIRQFALQDPRGFLDNYSSGAIFDEVQRVPLLFSYLQEILDTSTEKGRFILTGSNNFLLQDTISQSLAGRVGYLFLLPLSIQEIPDRGLSTDQRLFYGSYPELHSSEIQPETYYANYIRTYVERDVRLIKNITDLYTFERFLRLCAARVGQLLNMNSIAVETGVDSKTIASWIGILESSFIAFRLQPYHKNYNKRIVKMPKLYFYDTGLALSLLGFTQARQLSVNPIRGPIFENFVISEFLKNSYNAANIPNLFFWRDNTGHEIDLIVHHVSGSIPIEIKSGKTLTDEIFKGLRFWRKLTGQTDSFLIYDGSSRQKRSEGIQAIPFTEFFQTKISDLT